jgi:3',5'-cyclic AMP phosphodiesterase CpdA
MSTTLLHLSDTHFGTEQAPVVAALERLVHECRPAVAVLSGDVTQRATHSQFAAARAFMDRLAIAQWVVIPGNHDIPLYDLPARLFKPYGRYREVFGADLAPVVETADWLVLPHNTTRRWRHEDGEISVAQIDATAGRFRQAAQHSPEQLRLAVVHQPVAAPTSADRKNLLHGAQAATARWAEAGADLVLGGHIHLACVLPMQSRGDHGGRLWAVQAGTATSSRLRGNTPNSVNLLRPEKAADGQRGCRLERWDFDAATAAFRLAQSDHLLLGD